VDKPASLPVHPSGRYRHNTLLHVLRATMPELGPLQPICRLDRLTSGLLLLARSPAAACAMETAISGRYVAKTCVARVMGNFPPGELVCDEPIAVVSHKQGINSVRSDDTESRTVFRRLGGNDSTSVVECRPLTGRMHQIRVHLQHLGFPVVGELLYAHGAAPRDLHGPPAALPLAPDADPLCEDCAMLRCAIRCRQRCSCACTIANIQWRAQPVSPVGRSAPRCLPGQLTIGSCLLHFCSFFNLHFSTFFADV
jgi:hypothetical protein